MKATPPQIEQGTKSKSGLRTVCIPELLVKFLKRQPPHSPIDFVCTTTKGNLFTVTAWKELWNSYLLDLNIKYGDFSNYSKKYRSKFDPEGVPFVIERFTAHYLRHTFATNLFYCGKDLLFVQNQLGHAKPETTLNIYTHMVNNNLMKPGKRIININSYLNKIEKVAQ
jgi:integrase